MLSVRVLIIIGWLYHILRCAWFFSIGFLVYPTPLSCLIRCQFSRHTCCLSLSQLCNHVPSPHGKSSSLTSSMTQKQCEKSTLIRVDPTPDNDALSLFLWHGSVFNVVWDLDVFSSLCSKRKLKWSSIDFRRLSFGILWSNERIFVRARQTCDTTFVSRKSGELRRVFVSALSRNPPLCLSCDEIRVSLVNVCMESFLCSAS